APGPRVADRSECRKKAWARRTRVLTAETGGATAFAHPTIGGPAMRSVLALIAALIVTPAAAQQPKLEEGVMAVPVVSLSFSLGYLADDLNLWEKHGVRIKTVQISGIGAMNAVIAGSADFTQSSGSAVTRAAARGQKLIGIVGTINRPSVQIVLRKDMAAGFDAKA